MKAAALKAVIKRELSRLIGRRIYIVAMVAIPLFMSLFFISLLDSGLPVRVPVAMVDLDNSSMSRNITRNLSAMETVNIVAQATSEVQAIDMLNRGNIFGFFLIPDNTEKDAVEGRTPTLSYYTNMSFFIPSSIAYKGFKTIAVSTSGSMVKTSLVKAGADEQQVGTLLQPIVIQDRPIHNPWTNYSIYLSNSFIPGVIALMVLLVTVFSICDEIKQGSSIDWLSTAQGNLPTAIIGKLLPQTAIFSIMGIFAQSLLWGYNHFPLYCHPFTMIAAMILLVMASQSFALIVCSIMPNLRLALSIVSLLGILSFSIAGLSFPIESMYGAIGIFSYILPLRYYFLIYIDQALNGIDFYYSFIYFIILFIFPIITPLFTWRLRSRLSNPVYVP